jgi:hypothetical protein
VRERVAPSDSRGSRTSADWEDACERWWVGQVRYLMPIGPALWPKVLSSAEGVWRRKGLARVATLAWWNTVAALRSFRGLVRRAAD